MTEPSVSFAGNLTDDPELRHTEGGIARAMFRVAVSGRREQEASFFTVIVWRDQAEHAASRSPRAAGSSSWAGSSSGPGPPRTAAPDRRRGRGRGAGTEPAVGDGDHDQGDTQPGVVASRLTDQRRAARPGRPAPRCRPPRGPSWDTGQLPLARQPGTERSWRPPRATSSTRRHAAANRVVARNAAVPPWCPMASVYIQAGAVDP